MKKDEEKKKNDIVTGKKPPKEKSSRLKLTPLPLDHPVYSEGIIVGGRITRATLKEEAEKDEKKN